MTSRNGALAVIAALGLIACAAPAWTRGPVDALQPENAADAAALAQRIAQLEARVQLLEQRLAVRVQTLEPPRPRAPQTIYLQPPPAAARLLPQSAAPGQKSDGTLSADQVGTFLHFTR